LRAAAAVCVHQLEWKPAPVTMTSAFFATASPIRYSSFLALFPPKASPVRSSLFTQMRGPPSFFERFGISWMGVGRFASLALGSDPSLMSIGEDSHRGEYNTFPAPGARIYHHP